MSVSSALGTAENQEDRETLGQEKEGSFQARKFHLDLTYLFFYVYLFWEIEKGRGGAKKKGR